MGKLLVLRSDGIYTADGVTKYRPSAPRARRVEIIRQYDNWQDPHYQRRLNRRLGLNRFGGPLFRVVWGWSRLEFIGGLMDRYNDSGTYLGQQRGVFLEPKYSYLGVTALDRWIVEKWIPPEAYGTRESWEYEASEIDGEFETQALGPYPDRGDYELSFLVQDPKTEEFIQLTEDIITMTVDVALRAMEIDEAKRKEFLQKQQEAKERAFVNELTDLWDDSAVAFGGRPNSTQANAPMHNTRSSLADVSKVPAPAPKGLSVA